MLRLACSIVFLLTLAACDSAGVDPGPLPQFATDTLRTVDVDARATYLRTHQDGGALRARAFRLDSLGALPGDRITFLVAGEAVRDAAAPSASRTSHLTAVFSSSAQLLAPDLAQRVPGAVDAAAAHATVPTGVGALPTDIPQDFFATRATLLVPAGATHVFFSVEDAYFSDNQNAGEGLRVTLLRRRIVN